MMRIYSKGGEEMEANQSKKLKRRNQGIKKMLFSVLPETVSRLGRCAKNGHVKSHIVDAALKDYLDRTGYDIRPEGG